VKKIDTLKAYIKSGTKLFHLIGEKKVKSKTNHGKSEEKGDLGVLKVQMWYPNHAFTLL
jgi:hypothetical protein